MKSKFLIAGIILLAASALPAADKISFPPHPSSFDATKISRDPFAVLDETELANQKLAIAAAGPGTDLSKLFDLSTVSIGRLSIAIINKRAFATGDSFVLQIGSKEVNVVVLKITDGSVDLDCGGKRVTVPLHRLEPKALGER